MEHQSVLALGMFDGMHIGHQSLLWRTKALADKYACPAIVFTFSNHPMEVFGGSPKLLTTFPARERLMRACGIDDVVTVPFTKEFANQSPETFAEMLRNEFRPRAVVTGFNYTFAKGGAGTPKTLTAFGKRFGFDTHQIPPVAYLGAPVSSTRIRKCIESGDVKSAEAMLMRPYRLSGIVVENKKNGRLLGFPTANIDPDPIRALPKEGVYATICCVAGACFRAVTNIGSNPTLHGAKVTIESHLADFHEDIYGEMLTVDFIARLRDEIRFDGVDALKTQMGIDLAAARKIIS